MKKTLVIAAMVAVVCVLGASAMAGEGHDHGKEVTLTGWITDEYCGAKNANKDGADCAKACAKKGSDLMLFSDGEMYKLSDKELALKHVGYEVQVTGTLNDGGQIDVRTIEEVKEKA